MIRAIFFIGIGLILGGIAGDYIGAPGVGAWGLGVGISVSITALVFWMISLVTRGVRIVNPEVVKAAVQAGRVGMARVDNVQDTGTRINDQPLCKVELTVQPQHGQAYRTMFREVLVFEKRMLLAPGTTLPVAILAEGEPDISFLKPEDLRDPRLQNLPVPSVASAGEIRVPKSGNLRPNGKRTRPLLGTSKRWLPLRAVVYLVMICVGLTAVLLPMRDAVQLSVESKKATGSWVADMRTEPGLSTALAKLEEQIGHDKVQSVALYKDYIFIDAPIGPDTLNTDTWQYRGGKMTDTGPASTQPKSEKEFFKTSDVKWQSLWPAVQSVTSGLDQEITDDITISLERDTDSDVHSETFMHNIEDVIARFSISEPYSSSSYTMDGQGENITKN